MEFIEYVILENTSVVSTIKSNKKQKNMIENK